jgi:membrane associated rhomboid family serine protease
MRGIVAGVAHALSNLDSTVPAVGASGASSGVLGAYLLFFPRANSSR